MVHPFKVACAFRAARFYVAKSVTDHDNTSFICIGIDRARRAGRIEFDTARAAEAEIRKRIYPHTTVESWLIDQGFVPGGARPLGTFDKIQDYRHRWLEELAHEYFAKCEGIFEAPKFTAKRRQGRY